MNEFLTSQAIAAVAFACGIVSFQCRHRRSMLFWLSGSAIVNACHYFVLDRPEPGTLFVIMGMRSLAAAFSVNRKVMYLFLALMVAGFSLSYENPLGFLALFAALLATYGSFQEAEQRVRLIYMLAAVTWTVHNILVRTPVAALMEVTFLASNAIGYWRFHRGGQEGKRESE